MLLVSPQFPCRESTVQEMGPAERQCCREVPVLPDVTPLFIHVLEPKGATDASQGERCSGFVFPSLTPVPAESTRSVSGLLLITARIRKRQKPPTPNCQAQEVSALAPAQRSAGEEGINGCWQAARLRGGKRHGKMESSSRLRDITHTRCLCSGFSSPPGVITILIYEWRCSSTLFPSAALSAQPACLQ